VHVTVTLGVWHSSGDWDDDYDGRVDLLLLTFHEPELSTVCSHRCLTASTQDARARATTVAPKTS
jgi:hypothetical protein